MLKIHANVSKKVPVPGVEYSSQSYMAGIEVEVADSASPEELQERIREVYQLLERTIDTEIASQQEVAPPREPANRIAGYVKASDNGGNGRNGRNGNGRHATAAQVKAIFAISKALGMDRQSLFDLLEQDYGVGKPDELSVRDASSVIEKLKSMQSQGR